MLFRFSAFHGYAGTALKRWLLACGLLMVMIGASAATPWDALSGTQRTALSPLAGTWNQLPDDNQLKWLELANKFDKLSPEQRTRLQERMAEWARMSPKQRGEARLNFQESRQLNPGDRQSQWDAYKALPEEERQALAAKAKRPVEGGNVVPKVSSSELRSAPLGAVAPKDRLVPATPASGVPSRVVGPTLVASPTGATVALVNRVPNPPAHQAAGSPKITANPSQINRVTLLPRPPEAASAASSPAADNH